MAVTHSIGAYTVSDQVLSAVRDASRRTGVDFRYMLAGAARESAFRADSRAATSSAAGLYQFIDGTWLGMVKEHGGRHGLGHLAASISEGTDGSLNVDDEATRRRILDLRDDPRLSALMAGEFARDNASHLRRTVGGEVGPTELYLAHFLGPDGAARFLNARRATPELPAADLFPAAARANRAVFHDGDSGEALSLRAVYDGIDARVGVALRLADQVPAAASLAPRAATAAPAPRITTLPVAPAGDGARGLSLWTVLTLSALSTPGETGSRATGTTLPPLAPPARFG